MSLIILVNESRIPQLARSLRRRFGGRIVRPSTEFSVGENDLLFNYGCSSAPENMGQCPSFRVLNHWSSVATSVNKIASLQALNEAGVPTINWSQDADDVHEWRRIVVRHLVQSTGSRGIEIINTKGGEYEVPDAPLYTEYYRKTHEFRVHIFNGQCIDYTQKKRLSAEKLEARGIEPVKYIRSHANGWIFSRNNIFFDEAIVDLAKKATKAVDLNFCGVDILANVRDGELVDAVVCEVNSAPGMTGTTYKHYREAIQCYL